MLFVWIDPRNNKKLLLACNGKLLWLGNNVGGYARMTLEAVMVWKNRLTLASFYRSLISFNFLGLNFPSFAFLPLRPKSCFLWTKLFFCHQIVENADIIFQKLFLSKLTKPLISCSCSPCLNIYDIWFFFSFLGGCLCLVSPLVFSIDQLMWLMRFYTYHVYLYLSILNYYLVVWYLFIPDGPII